MSSRTDRLRHTGLKNIFPKCLATDQDESRSNTTMKLVRHHSAKLGKTVPVVFLTLLSQLWVAMSGTAQPYGELDRGQPGDAMIQEYLRRATEQIEASFLATIKSAEDWQQARPRLKQEYFDMLGLWPAPEKTPLQATITRTLDRGDYFIDMVHYQSRPGLYVT